VTRAAVVIVEKERVALIERIREGELYYLFPGGHIEGDETLEQAASREAKEELGLEVAVGQLLADVSYNENRQLYYVASVIGGSFGSGRGPEFDAPLHAGATFRPVWLPIDRLTGLPVHPIAVAQLVEASRAGWPDEAVVVTDAGRAGRSAA
jgi:8-oxo-dGTP pyrophosphatase MutT (NUDIX family)